MPPTPTRSTPRGGGRQSQSSSLHPQISGAGSAHPYASTTKGNRGPQPADALLIPFVHPALAQASGAMGNELQTAISAAGAAQSKGRRPFNHKNMFARDLRNLMYAYGDSANPLPDSVALMEEMMVEFITDLCCRARPSPYALGLGTSTISNSSSAFGATLEQYANAVEHGDQSGFEGLSQTLPPRAPHRLRVKLEDFRHALRKDVESKKLGRMEQLLYADKVVTEARRVGGVEEAAERAGALQTDNLPPPAAPNAPANDSVNSDSDDVSDDDMDDIPAGRKAGKGKAKVGGKGGGKGHAKTKSGTAGSKKANAKAGSARGSLQP